MAKLTILVVEDDELARIGLSSLLGSFGEIDDVESAAVAKERLESKKYDIAFIDLDLEYDLAGLELVKIAKEKGVYAVVLSGRESDEVILNAYESGCEDFLSKPYQKDVLERILRAFIVFSRKPSGDRILNNFITDDKEMVEQLKIVKDIVKSDQPIFILGPTGTGKSFLAKEIHNVIFDNDKFIALNCAELPENLLESELFGHEEGAFSGANSKKAGKLSLADGGTLFLDEIATMSSRVQQKLLKAIEEKTFYPLGSTKPVHSNFRLTSATCENINEMVEAGTFRRDLFFRIDGFKIELKALKDRVKDISVLIRYFNKHNSRRVVYKEDVVGQLSKYSWPGNVRELKKINEMLQLKGNGIVTCDDLPLYLTGSNGHISAGTLLTSNQLESIEAVGMKEFIYKIEKEIVSYYLKQNDNKVRNTMQKLGLSNNAFYRIMKNI